jgi:DNA mismatch repair protein MutL
MNKDEGIPAIRVLDEATITRIAAGEVIERPASVAKELLENAIDAGARRVRIEVFTEKRAIQRIRVTDDGSGMSPADAELAFAPHATSKIRSAQDLSAIRTLGFRGEALASIAAVARVTLVTKSRATGPLAGTKVVVEGGTTREVAETGVPAGTSLTVEDLFFNTPARKKFQKSLPTELAHLQHTVENAAFAHPEVAFTLLVNGDERLTTTGTGNLGDLLISLYGPDDARQIRRIDASFPFMRLSGYLSLPPFTRKTPGRLTLVINGRPVYSRQVLEAIREGYGTLLPKDRYPYGVLHMDLDLSLVDVNVHPAKHQVRMSRESEILRAVSESIEKALFSPDLLSGIHETEPGKPGQMPDAVCEALPAYMAKTGDSLIPPVVTHTGSMRTDRQLRQTELSTGLQTGIPALPDMDIIGQFGGIYLIAETPGGELMIIDQHAAHERILYEQVKSREDAEHQTQELLVPHVIRPRPADAGLLREYLPDLAREGFSIDAFGGNSFVVRAVPVVLGRIEDTGIIDEVIDELLDGPVRAPGERRERIAKIIACRGAIKAGTACTREQCLRLVEQLRQAKNPYTCPHGRPTIIRFSREQLDAMFRRT